MTAPARRRRRTWIVVAGVVIVVAVAAAVGIAWAVSGDDAGSKPGPPAFRPAPGKYRLAPHLSGNGAPPEPTLLQNGSARVLVAFGGAVTTNGHALAGLALSRPAPAGERTAGRYPGGAVIRLGAVRVTVLGVWDEPGESADRVDVQVSPG